MHYRIPISVKDTFCLREEGLLEGSIILLPSFWPSFMMLSK